MTIKELIAKLEQEDQNKKVSIAGDEHLDVVYDEICIEKINKKVVLFGLGGSEDF